MNTVPEMISTKDLSYIKDMFSWNFLATKKLKHILTLVSDSEVKEALTKAHDLHQNACHMILSFIEGGSNE